MYTVKYVQECVIKIFSSNNILKFIDNGVSDSGEACPKNAKLNIISWLFCHI